MNLRVPFYRVFWVYLVRYGRGVLHLKSLTVWVICAEHIIPRSILGFIYDSIFPISHQISPFPYRFPYRHHTIQTHSYQRFTYSPLSHNLPLNTIKSTSITTLPTLQRYITISPIIASSTYTTYPSIILIQITLKPLLHLHLSHFLHPLYSIPIVHR